MCLSKKPFTAGRRSRKYAGSPCQSSCRVSRDEQVFVIKVNTQLIVPFCPGHASTEVQLDLVNSEENFYITLSANC